MCSITVNTLFLKSSALPEGVFCRATLGANLVRWDFVTCVRVMAFDSVALVAEIYRSVSLACYVICRYGEVEQAQSCVDNFVCHFFSFKSDFNSLRIREFKKIRNCHGIS